MNAIQKLRSGVRIKCYKLSKNIENIPTKYFDSSVTHWTNSSQIASSTKDSKVQKVALEHAFQRVIECFNIVQWRVSS
jgi:hypothetical protein